MRVKGEGRAVLLITLFPWQEEGHVAPNVITFALDPSYLTIP